MRIKLGSLKKHCENRKTLPFKNLFSQNLVEEENNAFFHQITFLAALSSSRRLVVGRSVGPLVGPLEDLCEKVTFRVPNGN